MRWKLLLGLLVLSVAAAQLPSQAQTDLIASAEKEGVVILYSTLPSEFAAIVAERFNQAYPKIKVEWIRGSTSSMVQRYLTEVQARRVQVDVISHNDVGIFQEWAKTGLLRRYQSPEARFYPAGLGGGEYWTPFRAISTVISYNTRHVAARPTSMKDLLDPKYKGRISMLDPRTAGDALAFYYAIRNTLGVEYWRRMAQQGVEFQTSVGRVADQVSAGEKWIGLNADYRVVFSRDVEGAPIGVVWPAEGTVAIPTPVAITARGPHMNAAKVLYDWLLSNRGQQIVIKDLKQLSVRVGAGKTAGIPPIQAMKLLRVDFDALNKERNDVLKEFSEIFGLR